MEKPQEMAVTRIQTLGSNAALQSRLWTASASKLTPRSPSLTIQQMPSYSNRSILCRNMPYTKWCSSLELGNERILREIQMIPWSCKQKQSAQLNASQNRSRNGRSAKLLVARLTMNRSIKRKELQCHLLTCKPKRVMACTKHLAALASSKSFENLISCH